MSLAAHPALDELVAEIGELRPLPAVTVRILQIAGEDRLSAPELALAIASDQALTSKILRLANSAYYGFPRRITTVRDAVVLLGFRTIRSTALASSVMDTMHGPGDVDQERFWRYSVTVGVLAELLSRAGRQHLDEAFTAGVLHNIGRLALDQHRPGALASARQMAAAQGIPVVRAEEVILGYTDADLGAALATHWNFPPALCEAIAHHDLNVASLPDPGSLVAFVIRARLFARANGISEGVEPEQRAAPESEWLTPPLVDLLRNAGGIDGVRGRAAAFVETATTS